MAKTEPKTQPTGASVDAFIDTVDEAQKRADCRQVVKLMKQATRSEPRMWGSAIIGFGSYRLTYADGRQDDWPLVGFSPRKQNLALYVSSSFPEREALLARLGKHSTGKACVYVKRLSDVDVPTLKELIERSVEHMRRTYPPGSVG